MSRFRPATRSSFILQDAAGDDCNVRARGSTTTTRQNTMQLIFCVKWPNSITRQHSLPNLLDGDVGPQHRRLVHVPEAAVAHLVPLALRRKLRRVELWPIHHIASTLNLAATAAGTATETGSARRGRNTASKRGPGSTRSCCTADGVTFPFDESSGSYLDHILTSSRSHERGARVGIYRPLGL